MAYLKTSERTVSEWNSLENEKGYSQDFIPMSHLIISEPEVMDIPLEVQKDVDRLADIAEKAIAQRKLSKK